MRFRLYCILILTVAKALSYQRFDQSPLSVSFSVASLLYLDNFSTRICHGVLLS